MAPHTGNVVGSPSPVGVTGAGAGVVQAPVQYFFPAGTACAAIPAAMPPAPYMPPVTVAIPQYPQPTMMAPPAPHPSQGGYPSSVTNTVYCQQSPGYSPGPPGSPALVSPGPTGVCYHQPEEMSGEPVAFEANGTTYFMSRPVPVLGRPMQPQQLCYLQSPPQGQAATFVPTDSGMSSPALPHQPPTSGCPSPNEFVKPSVTTQ